MLTFHRRRVPAAVAALAIVATLSFSAPAQAEEVDPSTLPQEEVTTTEVIEAGEPTEPAAETTEVLPPEEEVVDEEGEDAPSFAARVAVPSDLSTTPAVEPVAPIACVVIPDSWATENLEPKFTAAGLVFDGPHEDSVNWYQRVSAGNAQGLTGMKYTLAPGTTGFKAEVKVEVNPRTDLGKGYVTYTTLSSYGGAATGVVDVQAGLWYASGIPYGQYGSLSTPVTWEQLIALMPNNTLLSAPSLHLQTRSTADSHSTVTSITSSCGTTDFTHAAPTVQQCVTPNLVPVAITSAAQLRSDSKSGGSYTVTTKGLELQWHGVGDDLSQSKAAWYYDLATPFPLNKLGATSLTYTSTSTAAGAAAAGENYTITVDGAWKGNIVKEPGIANYWSTFAVPGLAGDPAFTYRKAVGTIQDFVNAYWADSMSHVVNVIAIGGSGGSGSFGEGFATKQTAGCYVLTYGVPVPVTPPTTTPTNPGTTTGGTTTTTTTGAAATTTTPTSTPTPTPSGTASAAPDGEPSATADLPTEAFDSNATSGDAPWWPWVLGLFILLVLALLWFLVFRKRFGGQP